MGRRSISNRDIDPWNRRSPKRKNRYKNKSELGVIVFILECWDKKRNTHYYIVLAKYLNQDHVFLLFFLNDICVFIFNKISRKMDVIICFLLALLRSAFIKKVYITISNSRCATLIC